MKNTKIGLLMIAGVILIGIGSYSYFGNSKDLIVLKDDEKIITFELGNEISTNLMDYLDVTHLSTEQLADIQEFALVTVHPNQDNESGYQPVGKYLIEIDYKDDEETVDVEVVDTTEPLIVGDDKLTIEHGCNLETYDFDAHYTATDYSKVSWNYDYSAIDTDKAGDYQMTVKASDEYDNSSSKRVKVVVETQAEEINEAVSVTKAITDNSQSSTDTNTSKERATTEPESPSPNELQNDQESSDERSQRKDSVETNDSSEIELKKTDEGDLDIGGYWESFDIVGGWPDEWE